MKRIQVFIMGAGKGSRLKYDLGKKMPKCLLPSCMVSPKYITSALGDTILYRIIKSFMNAGKISDCLLEFDLMISHKNSEIKEYINREFPNVNLHQIDWSPSSITTFQKCVDIVKNKSKKTKFDQCVFVNGDTYIDNIESMSYTLADMFTNEVSTTSAIIEYFKEPVNVFSEVELSDSKNTISHIYGDYVDTTETLCDITQFDLFDLYDISDKFKEGFNHEWWEMAFYEEVNYGNLIMSAIPIRKITYDRVLYNTNNIRDDVTELQVNKILTSFNLNFKEEEIFDGKEI